MKVFTVRSPQEIIPANVDPSVNDNSIPSMDRATESCSAGFVGTIFRLLLRHDDAAGICGYQRAVRDATKPSYLDGNVGIDQNLGVRRCPSIWPFKDEHGKSVTLADYFDDKNKKPVILARWCITSARLYARWF